MSLLEIRRVPMIQIPKIRRKKSTKYMLIDKACNLAQLKEANFKIQRVF
jgi:hypothetical protein